MTLHGIKERKKLFSVFFTISSIFILISFCLYFFFLKGHISTDNAYTNADMAEVTSMTSGIVKEIRVMDTQHVEKGDVLVVLDDTDARLALSRAEAGIKRAEANLKHSKLDFERKEFLLSKKAGSAEDVTVAENALRVAEAELAQAQVDGEQAKINCERTMIKAPMSGIVSKRDVQLGQRVDAGKYMLSIVPLSAIYVNANFKEGQLSEVCVGQQAEVTSDLYGSRVVYRGTVVGLSGGTGSAFAIIPAQNATGNWIKVVQRLPVRIALNPDDLKQHPLRVGLSMDVTINVSQSGSQSHEPKSTT